MGSLGSTLLRIKTPPWRENALGEGEVRGGVPGHLFYFMGHFFLIYYYFEEYFWAIPSGAWGLLRALHSETIPGGARGPYGMVGSEPGWVT